MICVSIGRGRHRMMIAEHRHLAEQGVQLVELRLDYIRRAVNLKRLLSDRPCPVIATCRRREDGGMWEGTEEDRQMLLRTAIVDGADYVDLEEDIAGKIPRYGKTRRIVSYHNFNETPDNLEQIHGRLAGLDADIVKIATMANTPHDNVRVLSLMEQADIPTIAICMGEIGTPSRILAGKFGAPFTYATFHHERQLAPGQLSYREMVDIYHYDDIKADTEVYGVVADPVAQNLNPVIHNAAFAHLKLNKVYVPFRVPRGDLDEFLFDCRKLGVRGLTVGMPHREDVLRGLGEVDGAVNGIGMANTVIFEDHVVVGYNTDFHAAMDCLEEVAKKKAVPNPFLGRKALILGAGAMAKTIAFGLKRRRAEVVITSRTRTRADLLARQMGCRAVDWEDRHREEIHLLINATPVGMHPNVDETPFEGRYLDRSIIVMDTVYNPEQTLLIKEAKSQGCRVVTGVELLLRQAAMQFKFFTNQEAPVDVMREHFKRAVGPVKQ